MSTFCSHIDDESLALNKIYPINIEKDDIKAYFKRDEPFCKLDFNYEYAYIVKIKSSLSYLQPVIAQITDNLVKNHNFPLEKQVDIFLILSELLVNAIEHGNKNIYDKTVLIYYYIFKDSVGFIIEDEGSGISNDMLNGIKQSQGLSLIQALSTCFCWNKKGNTVCVRLSR